MAAQQVKKHNLPTENIALISVKIMGLVEPKMKIYIPNLYLRVNIKQ